MQDSSVAIADQLTLCEALDRVLHKGVVVVGDVRISVANIDLIHVSLQLMASSVEQLYDDHGASQNQDNSTKESCNPEIIKKHEQT